MPKYYLLLPFLVVFGCQKSNKSVEASEPQLFSLLSPEQTQVNFQNNIQEGLNTNVLMYEYFYNGVVSLRVTSMGMGKKTCTSRATWRLIIYILTKVI